MDNSKEILINSAIGETRMALLENGQVSEIRLFRDHHPSYMGAVYLGRVSKLSSELQAAFIDLGNNISGFLPLKTLPKIIGKKPKDLTSLLHEGERIIVQVTADATAGKSLKLTARPELVSTAVVFHPMRAGAFVSSRIKDPDRRTELKEFGKYVVLNDMGLTFRTEAADIPLDQLGETAGKLIDHWKKITRGLKNLKCPSLLSQGPDPIEQIMREFTSADISAIIIDQASALKTASLWAKNFAPDLISKISHYKSKQSLFSHYEVDDQIEQITSPHISLNSGAWITIEQTEALTVIDVNMAGAQFSSDHNKQIFSLNREAAREIFRQLRLRGIGGIIVIDFVDMKDKGQIKSLLHFIDELMLSDPEPVQRGNISSFGLLELTRRTKQNNLN
ncbi:MAG: ribonuclease E/G, partial [Kordiimonadaceae bacterium]|nr:ribonuclease E/G [Kordiimonadaceae bacterium]